MVDDTPIIITSTNRFGIDIEDADSTPADPFALLGMWLPDNTDDLRPLMTLSTHGPDGYPDSRHLLLSAFDGESLHFHTDARTRKAAELEADGRVSLAIVWVVEGRQLTVAGDAVRVPATEAALAYAKRSRYLQLLAWLNTAEMAQLTRDERVAAWNRWSDEHPADPLETPATWVGYRVVPHRLTFWRGDADGPSNRVEYTRTGDGWDVARLPG
ncbi:pyridoxine/pyridoxamine 5'-phosphate oxidase [Demequina mangrovi]|uniref:Pyridoxamine 5'-phosphate oxidase n=1 Tax=Demequina mangrovi TaxID=1043493 RepID=A0A1H7A6W2_9MICO|nr:pyridoxamine 5'-phosphate oxidase family protein [Demequina mangrovi]SEJ59647.1 Pyridoxamine 5'-phosphate oxidase [Demequina mangrovi]